MIPVGAQVRWRPDVYKAPPIGRVTSRVGRMLDIDGRGWWVSEGLLEVVGEMVNGQVNFNALVAERDALQAVVVQQCEALGGIHEQHAKDLQDEYQKGYDAAKNSREILQLYDAAEAFTRLRDAVRTMFLNVFDTREPSGMDCRARELDMLDLIAEMARYEG